VDLDNKRADGKGSVTQCKDGRFWARAPRQPDGSRPSFGKHDTEAEAERALAIGMAVRSGMQRGGGLTFEEFGLQVLDDRELAGIRSTKQDRNRFKVHLATAPFARKPIEKVTTVDGAEWIRQMSRKRAQDRRGDRLVSPDVTSRALSLANAIMHEAGPQGRGLIDRNPFLELRVKKRADEAATKQKWTFLTSEEQDAVLHSTAIAPGEKWPILFAAGCGIRQGEQFNLELRDLHVGEDEPEPHAIIRFGSKGKPRKNGKTYTVQIFGIALLAAREWLKLLPSFCPINYDRLVFPLASGCRRAVGKPLGNGHFRPVELVTGPTAGKPATHRLVSGKPVRDERRGTHRYVDRLDEVLALAGIVRVVRWHDMRHTCASSLVQGEWTDENVPLEVIREQLDHSSITVTQRYAHLGETATKKLARKVRSVVVPAGVEPATPGLKGPCSAIELGDQKGGVGYEWVTRGSNSSESKVESNALKGPSLTEQLRALTAEKGSCNPLVTHLAAALASALQS
jgi:integrase